MDRSTGISLVQLACRHLLEEPGVQIIIGRTGGLITKRGRDTRYPKLAASGPKLAPPAAAGSPLTGG